MNAPIRSRHDGNRLEGGMPKLRRLPTLPTALSDLRRLREGQHGVASAGFSELEAFAERYMDLRDDLAWRAARGEALDPSERAMLHAFDAIIDSLMPAPEPLPEDVLRIVDDVLRSV